MFKDVEAPLILNDWIIFFTDKGNSVPNLLKALTGEPCLDHNPDCPVYSLDQAEQAIRALITNGILTCGSCHGWDEWVVVTSFMPRTAQRLRHENV